MIKGDYMLKNRKSVLVVLLVIVVLYLLGYFVLVKPIRFVDIYASFIPELLSICLTVFIVDRLFTIVDNKKSAIIDFFDDINLLSRHFDEINSYLKLLNEFLLTDTELSSYSSEQVLLSLKILRDKRIPVLSFSNEIIYLNREKRIKEFRRLEDVFILNLDAFLKEKKYSRVEVTRLLGDLARTHFELLKLRSSNEFVKQFEDIINQN